MKLNPADRRGMTSSVSAAILIAILVVAASASYLAFSQGTTGPSTTSTTPDATTAYPSTGSGSSVTSSTTSSAESTSSSSSAADSVTTSSSTTTTSFSDQTSSASLNSSEVLVIIPFGIEKISNKISFEPINVTVVIGVNNTIVFANHDDQEHILESTSWPQTGQPFQIYSLPGKSDSVTLTTPGTYTYFCEWHPIWMDGTINVVA